MFSKFYPSKSLSGLARFQIAWLCFWRDTDVLVISPQLQREFATQFTSPLPISSMHTGANAHWLKHLENEEQEGDGGSHFTQHMRPSHNTGSQFCCVPVCFRRWTKMMQACKIGRVAPLLRQARQFLPCQQLQGVRWGSRGPAKPEAPYS